MHGEPSSHLKRTLPYCQRFQRWSISTLCKTASFKWMEKNCSFSKKTINVRSKTI
jgi:hypothetical protein